MKDKTGLYAVDLSDCVWRKSSRTIDNPRDYNCVEWAKFGDGCVAIRDSNRPSLPPLRFDAAEWSAFCTAVQLGETS